MKRIKYIICILLIIAGVLFNGELSMLYLDNFPSSYYKASFYYDALPVDYTNDDIINDFLKHSDEYDVDFFVVDYSLNTATNSRTTIYGTDRALDYLDFNGVSENMNKSIFFGNNNVIHKDIRTLDDMSRFEYVYFIGDEEKKDDLFEFKRKMVNKKYSGSFPKKYGSEKETIFNLGSVWAIIFAFIIAMTMYEVIYKKKEITLRVILGENLNYIFLKSILFDNGIIIIMFIVIPFLLQSFSNTFFKIALIYMFLAGFILINTLIHSFILFVNFKKDISKSNNKTLLYTINYGLKVLTCVLAIVTLSTNFVVIKEGYDFSKQKSFFEKHKDYSYYELGYKIGNEIDNEESKLINDFYQRFNNNSLQYIETSFDLSGVYPKIIIDEFALKELLKEYSKLEKIIKDVDRNKPFVILPSQISLDSDIYEKSKSVFEEWITWSTPNHERYRYNNKNTVTYDFNLETVGIDNRSKYSSVLLKNPVIFYNSNNIIKASESSKSILYNISKKDYEKFIKDYNLENQITTKTNIYELYKYKLNKIMRTIKMLSVLSFFIFLLEFMLIMFIIRVEYSVNAIELSLMKIHGYTIYERNSKIIKITLITISTSIVVSYLVSKILRIFIGKYIIISGLLLLLLEIIYIIKKAKETEKNKVSRILKGEVI